MTAIKSATKSTASRPARLPQRKRQGPTETETLLEQASQRFQQLFHGLPIACFCYDAHGCIIEWNVGCESLFHRPPGQALLMPAWEVIGRPEDAEIMRALVRSVISGQSYEGVEWEDLATDGVPRYLLCNAFPLRDKQGKIYGGISVHVDISERVRVEQALWESEERWQLALRGNNDGVWDWNTRAGTLFISERGKQIRGEEKDEAWPSRPQEESEEEVANGKEVDGFVEAWFERVHPEDKPGAIAAFHEHLDRSAAFYTSEHRVRCRYGTYKWILDRGQALWDRAGRVVRVAGSITDVTERKRYEQYIQEAQRKLEMVNRQLEALATQDGLTGLKNHRAFAERLEMEVERATRYGVPLCLALLDVDSFKGYNDTFGHPAGDSVLRTVARLLEASVREADLVARYGGEEFVLILPHTQTADAMMVAERCRAAIEGAGWPERAVTASFGVASLGPAIKTTSALVVAADQALYHSKRTGRNRVSSAAEAAASSEE